MQIIQEIDENNTSIHLRNARKIKDWINNSGNTKPPSRYSENEEEAKLGVKLSFLKYNLITPYLELKTEQERESYKKEHLNLEEIMEIVQEIDENNISIHLRNARRIKAWMEHSRDTKQPSSIAQDEEERSLGVALRRIRKLIEIYLKMETDKEKEDYIQKYPDLEEVMQIIQELDINSSIYLRNAREIKEWIENLEDKRVPNRCSKNEEEVDLSKKLISIRTGLINPYLKLETEQERVLYRQKHPELNEVMEIVYDISKNFGDKTRKKYADKIKKTMKKTVVENIFTNKKTREDLNQLTNEFRENEQGKGVNRDD